MSPCKFLACCFSERSWFPVVVHRERFRVSLWQKSAPSWHLFSLGLIDQVFGLMGTHWGDMVHCPDKSAPIHCFFWVSSTCCLGSHEQSGAPLFWALATFNMPLHSNIMDFVVGLALTVHFLHHPHWDQHQVKIGFQLVSVVIFFHPCEKTQVTHWSALKKTWHAV